jgi:hypothetical protein
MLKQHGQCLHEVEAIHLSIREIPSLTRIRQEAAQYPACTLQEKCIRKSNEHKSPPRGGILLA